MREIFIAVASRSIDVFLDDFNRIAWILFAPILITFSHRITPFMQLTGPALIRLQLFGHCAWSNSPLALAHTHTLTRVHRNSIGPISGYGEICHSQQNCPEKMFTNKPRHKQQFLKSRKFAEIPVEYIPLDNTLCIRMQTITYMQHDTHNSTNLIRLLFQNTNKCPSLFCTNICAHELMGYCTIVLGGQYEWDVLQRICSLSHWLDGERTFIPQSDWTFGRSQTNLAALLCSVASWRRAQNPSKVGVILNQQTDPRRTEHNSADNFPWSMAGEHFCAMASALCTNNECGIIQNLRFYTIVCASVRT